MSQAIPGTVPVGLSTQVGLGAAAAQFAAALVSVLVDGDHSTETVTLLVTATLTLLSVLHGRYAQAKVAARPAAYIDRNLGNWTSATGAASNVQVSSSGHPYIAWGLEANLADDEPGDTETDVRFISEDVDAAIPPDAGDPGQPDPIQED